MSPMSLPDKVKPAAITLQFDYAQASQQLYWSACEDHRDIYEKRGRAAGALWLRPDEDVSIVVKGGGYVTASSSWSFSIVDCYLVTLPQATWSSEKRRTTDSPPSPFARSGGADPGSAVRAVENLRPTHEIKSDDQYLTYIFTADKAFRVIATPTDTTESIGRWDLSFVLTVRITDLIGGTYVRVFRFDPETEVGNGLNL